MNKLVKSAAIAAILLAPGAAYAGPVFLTGHDPDFHAQDDAHGAALLNAALNFVTGGSYNDGAEKFLFVESNVTPPLGFRTGELGLNAIGLTAGIHYDAVDAAGLAALSSFSGYSAIVAASSFGGMLTDAEITGLVARAAEIASFVNAGGGLAAFAECFPESSHCRANNVNENTQLFGFVPVDVTSVATSAPYTVTPFGASIGLTNEMVSACCTHNSFGLIGGLTIADTDQNGVPTTLAGNVRITDGGFVSEVPEPVTLSLLGAGLLGLGAIRRRRD